MDKPDLIFLKGFFLSLSLIMAIGAQNAFVLRQGIAKNNVFYVCLVCFLCDFVLILAGIFGVGEVLAKNVIVNVLITTLGILFVSYCFFSNFEKKTLRQILAVLFYNPISFLCIVSTRNF